MSRFRWFIPWFSILLRLLLLQSTVCSHAIRLQTTSSKIRSHSRQELHQFLATPSNWPKIVLSSWSVKNVVENEPLKRGEIVKEVFGLPPIWPLKVTWQCVESNVDKARFDVVSPTGVEGLASNCRMLFEINDNGDDNVTQVQLTMDYEPASILAKLATPILVLDNALALKVLLPLALQRQPQQQPLDKFCQLMGNLYGVAGLIHFADCLVGPSQLITSVGCPPYPDLPVEGQALALLWCAAGPAALVAARMGRHIASLGLIGYGLIEVLAVAVASNYAASLGTVPEGVNDVMNAVGVQAIVAAAWVYSWQKGRQTAAHKEKAQ